MVYIVDSKSAAARHASSSLASGTRNRKRGSKKPTISNDNELRAYVIGLAIGDGNLSNPNGRATRLRISCDARYTNLILKISNALRNLLPENSILLIARKNSKCIDITCYSNHLEELLGWKARKGSKFIQNVSIPNWIKANEKSLIKCLCGLFETDGSIYYDRKYKMINFVTIIESLARDVTEAMISFGFEPRMYIIKQKPPKHTRYNIRLCKEVEKFINLTGINKS